MLVKRLFLLLILLAGPSWSKSAQQFELTYFKYSRPLFQASVTLKNKNECAVSVSSLKSVIPKKETCRELAGQLTMLSESPSGHYPHGEYYEVVHAGKKFRTEYRAPDEVVLAGNPPAMTPEQWVVYLIMKELED